MTEEGFAAWLKPFNLSEDYLLQCLELGQVALDRRKSEAAERENSFKKIVKKGAESNEPRNLAGL